MINEDIDKDIAMLSWVYLTPIQSQKNWYNFRYVLSYLKLYLKLCKKKLGKPDSTRVFLHNLRYNFEVQFRGRLKYTPSRCRQKLSTTSTRVLSPPPPSCCAICCPIALHHILHPLFSLCHPPPNRPAVVSPFPPCLMLSTPPPSHCVVRCPPALLFDCCVLDWWRWDLVTNPMSCVVRPFSLTVLSSARLLCIL
jgi:hypothetical protein